MDDQNENTEESEPQAYEFARKAHTLAAEGQYIEAIENYTLAIRDNPEFASAYYHRAICHFKMNRFRDALDDCTKAIKHDPEYAEAYETRANAYEKMGMAKEAASDREKAKRIGSETL